MAFPNVRSEIISRRTYHRPLNDEGTLFETLEQGTERIIDHQRWLWERQLGRDLIGVEEEELNQLRRLLLDLTVSTSGRNRWLGGTKVAMTREASQFNPLAMDTQFITASGVRDFHDMAEGEKVTVMTHEGNWRYATAHNAGTRKMVRIGFKGAGNRQNEQFVDSSVDHTWILSDGSRVEARELKVGDLLVKTPGGMSWKVTSLEEIPDEPCWCLTVQDEAHSFMLANGVPTGNCSFLVCKNPVNLVDAFWLLLQGCGVGFKPCAGVLRGFHNKIEVTTTPSVRTIEDGGGHPDTQFWIEGDTATLILGDSAEMWAKSIGKIFTLPPEVRKLHLDFSQIRAAGIRLKGYGWISSGYKPYHDALLHICEILNERQGTRLSCIDILDVMNLLGTTLSSRRSAEICLLDYDHPESFQFISAKKDYWKHAPWRGQSNNTTIFNSKPSRLELLGLFDTMAKAGGSEPGFANGEALRKRADWWEGGNPCFEILLSDSGFCNLVEVNLNKFTHDASSLLETMWLIARANYRQTCVNLKDGVLSETWHEANDYLRLCGVGITGIGQFDPTDVELQRMREAAHSGANSMADELGTPRSKAITTVKPSGTLSKVMGCWEGVHKPLGRYIFNNVNFGKDDPLIPILKEAGYKTFVNPYDPENGVIVTFPVDNGPSDWDVVHGVEVNLESAVTQLNRYKRLMDNYVDHNCSVTISYSPDEVPEIVQWLLDNWDSYCGVSWLYRNDPTKTAEDLGHAYLPQEVVSKERHDEYVAGLKEISLEGSDSLLEIESQECAGGACPVK